MEGRGRFLPVFSRRMSAEGGRARDRYVVFLNMMGSTCVLYFRHGRGS